MSVQTRRVLVTGGSTGIGAEICRTLAREGAELALHYNSNRERAEVLAADLGGNVHLIGGNLLDDDAPARLWEAATEALGGVDVLVNNAGAWWASPLEPAEEWSAGWDANLRLNLQAPAELCRLAVLDFAEREGGTIINMTSRSAHRGDDADHLAYGVAKAGLANLTKGIARGYGRRGVVAFNISPGWVATDLAAGQVDDEQLAGLPLGEITPPQEVAETVAFLASGRARHLSGATLDVTGADYVR